ncbi:MAG TPA: cytochrome P450 [Frankiaceae bacterium]|jgi:cytochrome P450|nr:cytochrome P450 [Frankiaceae bacterium]
MTELALDRERLRSLFDLRSDIYASRGGTFDTDPYPTFARLRETGPVHPGAPHEELGWTGEVYFQGLPYPNRPHFSAYDYETCARVLKDDEDFVTSMPALPGEPPMLDAGILTMDGKRHRSYRKLVQPSFVPGRAVWWLENWTRIVVNDLIDGLIAGDGHADLNAEFCAPIPLLTITGSFGVTIEEALDVRAAVTSDGSDTATLARLLIPTIAARRAHPEDDLISILVQAEVTDEDGVLHRLSDEEVLGFAFLLLAAGSGTTWKQLGLTIIALLRHPRALAAAREDRGFLRGLVEESLRWMPTDPVFARFVARDTTLGGVDLPAGAVIHACLAAANRDATRWERPDEFDPFRPVKAHLGFGFGPHTCLGAHVARMEITHGVGALLDRLPGLQLDPDRPAPRVIGLYERGPDTVPVTFGSQTDGSGT